MKSFISEWLDGSGDSGYPINTGYYVQNYGPWFKEVRGGLWAAL